MVERGEIKRLMILTPPQVGKSTLVSQFFPAWYLGRNPDRKFVLASYSMGLAVDHSKMARQNMREDGYRRVFGDLSGLPNPVQLAPKASATNHWRLDAPHRGTFKAAGVGSGLTGFGADLIDIDDPVGDPKDAESDIIRESVINWYKQVAYSRLSHGEDGEGSILLTQTRWHDNDLSGYLLKQQAEGGDLWYVLRLPAAAEDPLTIEEWAKANFITPDRLLVADTIKGIAA
jgi:hypothetical protein